MNDQLAERVPLLVDVDGVLNVIGAGVEGVLDRNLAPFDAVAHTGDSYRLLIDPLVGQRLLSLTDIFELVWCTTWVNANEAISPLVGLPDNLRRVPIPGVWSRSALSTQWSAKVPFIRAWAADNGVERLAWIDDDIGPMDTRALCTVFDRELGHVMAGDPPLADVLALHIPPHRGLERHHVDQLREWCES